MAEPYPPKNNEELHAQALNNFSQVLTPRQLYFLSSRLLELSQKHGFGEIHIIVAEGQVTYIRLVQSDKVSRM